MNRQKQKRERLGALKAKAGLMKRQLTAIYYASQDPRLPWLPRLIAIACLAYALSPIDLIPDFIPVIGYLDDLIIIPALLGLAVKLIPEPVIAEARQRAEREPFLLRKNWAFAVIFICVWALILIGATISILRLVASRAGTNA